MEEMANIYAKLINQNKFKYQLPFLALSSKIGEEDEIISEI